MLYFIQLDALVTKYKPKFNKSKAILFPSYDCWNLVSRLCFLHFCYSFTSPVRGRPEQFALNEPKTCPMMPLYFQKATPIVLETGSFLLLYAVNTMLVYLKTVGVNVAN